MSVRRRDQLTTEPETIESVHEAGFGLMDVLELQPDGSFSVSDAVAPSRGIVLALKDEGNALLKAGDLAAILTNLDLHDAKIAKANLNSTNLSGANLSNANFIEADLTEANLSKAELHDA